MILIIERGDMVNSFLDFVPENLRARLSAALVMIPVAIFVIYSWQFLFNFFILVLAILMGFEWITIAHEQDKISNRWKFLGLLYILTPCVSLMFLKNIKGGEDIIMYLMLMVWGTDSGAMLIGKTIGGPKIFPAISPSPNKSWSGLAGGILVSMIVGFFFSFAFQKSISFFVFFSGFFAILEQVSDMLESKFKRTFGVKDSGNLIPGHGGILDRVDGLTLTTPLIALITTFGNVF
jgi:phosphatidate cytidylyltransferase